MAHTTYTYSRTADFPTGLVAGELFLRIEADPAIVQRLIRVNDATSPSDDVEIEFEAPLGGAEQTALDALIAAYTVTDQYLLWIFADQKLVGTNGGDAAAGTWQTRTLNTASGSSHLDAQLSGNQITLAPGLYEVYAEVPAFRVGNHQGRLYNVTDDQTALLGTVQFSNLSESTSSQTSSTVRGVVLVTGSNAKVFEVQHYCAEAQLTEGLGRASGLDTEVYTLVRVQKLET